MEPQLKFEDYNEQRDRERQNLLVEHGWRPLRYFAKEIHKESARILDQIERVLNPG